MKKRHSIRLTDITVFKDNSGWVVKFSFGTHFSWAVKLEGSINAVIFDLVEFLRVLVKVRACRTKSDIIEMVDGHYANP